MRSPETLRSSSAPLFATATAAAALALGCTPGNQNDEKSHEIPGVPHISLIPQAQASPSPASRPPAPASQPKTQRYPLPTCGEHKPWESCMSRPSTAPGNVFGIVPSTNGLHAAELLGAEFNRQLIAQCGSKRANPYSSPFHRPTFPEGSEAAIAPWEVFTVRPGRAECVQQVAAFVRQQVSAVKPGCGVAASPVRAGRIRTEQFCFGKGMNPNPNLDWKPTKLFRRPASRPSSRPANSASRPATRPTTK